MNKTDNILITGGAGYIGSHIVEKLVQKKKNIIVLDNLDTGHKRLINKKTTFIKGDIKNFKKLIKIINFYEINAIIHLAANLNISDSQKNKTKYYKNNIQGTLNVVKACKGSKVKNIIFSSSCSVYGDVNGLVNEKNRLNPKSYYGYTKYKGEKIIKKYAKINKYNYSILRYFNVAGASPSGKIGEVETSHGHLFKTLAAENLKKNPKMNIFGHDYKTKDGTCIRDYIHVVDLAEIHIKFLKYITEKSKSIVVNCGYGKGYSVKDVANLFKKINKKVVINYKPRRDGDVAQVFADTKKIKKLINFKPKYNNISKILKSAFKWEKKYKD